MIESDKSNVMVTHLYKQDLHLTFKNIFMGYCSRLLKIKLKRRQNYIKYKIS